MKDWNDYQVAALATAVYPLERALDYTVLGLLSEIGELGAVFANDAYSHADKTKNIHAELSDCFWYAAAIADSVDTRLADVAPRIKIVVRTGYNSATFLALTVAAGNIAGIVKKAIRDNEGYLAADKKEILLDELANVLSCLESIAKNTGTSRKAIWAYNLNKLASRKQRGVLQGSGDNR